LNAVGSKASFRCAYAQRPGGCCKSASAFSRSVDNGAGSNAGVATSFHCTNFGGLLETIRFAVRNSVARSSSPQPIGSRPRVVCGHRRLIRGIVRCHALDVEPPPETLRNDAGPDIVPVRQISHRLRFPCRVIGSLGGSIRARRSEGFRLARHGADSTQRPRNRSWSRHRRATNAAEASPRTRRPRT
jgi:hypothetical protein